MLVEPTVELATQTALLNTQKSILARLALDTQTGTHSYKLFTILYREGTINYRSVNRYSTVWINVFRYIRYLLAQTNE